MRLGHLLKKYYVKFSQKSYSKIIAVADNSPTKIGKLTPGTHIPIVPDKEFNNMEIDYAFYYHGIMLTSLLKILSILKIMESLLYHCLN